MSQRSEGEGAKLRLDIESRRAMVYDFARRWLRDDNDAEDATQEIMIKLLRDCQRLRAVDRLEPWIYRVATNTLINFKRRARRIEALESAAAPPRDPDLDAARLASEREQRTLVAQSVAELPASLRSVVILKYYQALNQTEISEVLERPRSTVQSQLKKGLERLKAQLSASGAGMSVPELERLLTAEGPPSPGAASSPLITKSSWAASALAGLTGVLALKLKIAAVAAVTLIATAGFGLVLLAPSREPARQAPLAKAVPSAPLPPSRAAAPPREAAAPAPAARPALTSPSQRPEAEFYTAPPPPGWHDPVQPGILVTVLDESTGAPIEGVRIDSSEALGFYPASAREAPAQQLAVKETDAAGQIFLALRSLKEPLSLELSKAGYIGWADGEERRLAPSHSFSIPLLASELADAIAVTLIPGSVIRGEVYEPGGQPIDADLRLFCVSSEDESARRGLVQSIRARDGAFTLIGLKHGSYELLAKHPDYIHARRSITIDPLNAAPFLRLQLGRGESIAGRVTDEDGRPVAGAEVVVRPTSDKLLNPLGSYKPRYDATTDGQLSKRFARCDESGTFRVSGLGPGEIDVYALASGFETAVRRKVAAGETGVDFRLTAGGVIAGRVLTSQGDPVKGGRIWIKREGDRVSMRDIGIDREGRFRAEKLFKGAYWLLVKPEGYGQRNLHGVASGTTDLRIKVSPSLILRGRVVQTGEKIDWIRIVAESPRGGFDHVEVRVGADGRFEATMSVAPPLRSLSFIPFGFAPIVFKDLPGSGGELDGFELRFEAASSVSGRVVDGRGAPVQRAWISSSKIPFPNAVDEDGRFTIGSLPSGLQTITVSPPGGKSVAVEVHLGPGEKREGFVIVVPDR